MRTSNLFGHWASLIDSRRSPSSCPSHKRQWQHCTLQVSRKRQLDLESMHTYQYICISYYILGPVPSPKIPKVSSWNMRSYEIYTYLCRLQCICMPFVGIMVILIHPKTSCHNLEKGYTFLVLQPNTTWGLFTIKHHQTISNVHISNNSNNYKPQYVRICLSQCACGYLFAGIFGGIRVFVQPPVLDFESLVPFCCFWAEERDDIQLHSWDCLSKNAQRHAPLDALFTGTDCCCNSYRCLWQEGCWHGS